VALEKQEEGHAVDIRVNEGRSSKRARHLVDQSESLHPDRSELSVPSSASSVGVSLPLRRACSRDQCWDAELCRAAIQDQLNVDGKPLRGSVVLLLGVTYKPDIGDTRESPAVPVAKTLLQHGAQFRFHDPLVKQFAVSGYEVARVVSTSRWPRRTSASCCKIIAVMTSK
jgi:hypothetical protein